MRVRPVKDRFLIKHLKTNPSKIIQMPDGLFGTFTKSLLPGTRSLAEVDAGNVRLNLGLIVESNKNTKLPLKKGDYVLFKQGSALSCMGLNDSKHLAEMYEDSGAQYFLVAEKDIEAILPDGNPGDGVFR